MTSADSIPDVLIVGSGIMGAGVAAALRKDYAGIRIVMVDGGSVIGDTPGLHLHESKDPAIWSRYNQAVATGIQGLYASGRPHWEQEAPPRLEQLPPGVHRLSAFGEDTAQTPNAAAAWNVGGMGVHWTAATPRPWGFERFDTDDASWDRDIAEAERLLGVHPGPLGPSEPGRIVLDVLRARFLETSPPGREPQLMPMAVRRESGLVRNGPQTIFPPMAEPDADFTLLPSTLATSLTRVGRRVTGAVVRDVASGEDRTIRARAVVVCADAHRTPQLLFASGIRPPALGRHLNVHAFLSGRVLMDLERRGLALSDLPRVDPGEFATDSLWLPHTGEDRPFQAQIMNTVYSDEFGQALAYSVGLSIYVPMESLAANRIIFSDTDTDLMGMPKMRLEFAYSERDHALIDRARDLLAEMARDFGPFDPVTESALLPPGSSLHQTGTVRSGLADDGESVCDPHGRVWGTERLWVAGNGVVPTPLSCNSTLPGMVTAVRASRSVGRELAA
jgi:choline dehydrogenase-like flavoprotein